MPETQRTVLIVLGNDCLGKVKGRDGEIVSA